ncbi:hypothetical protein [Candidatus Nitrotoga arctica]|uniref:Uncharacterized protein n=1 Tax=Candidatus Nitrotoga arctica TaxID=453162 RepID=A0ABM8Z0B0_9PROT|nr:hypothetical protein [Candidatus Nitrotoga arctica]CAG9933152.1 protein of unknown function [Candidatus Nitrotoga arctica]
MSGTIHSITIHASFPGKVNFAAHQNAVPIVRDLGIENSSEEQYQNLRLTISAHPAFLRERVWILDRLESKTSLHIKDSLIDYDANMLFGLNEAINADIRLTLTTDHGEILSSHQERVRVLSRNEWGARISFPNFWQLLFSQMIPPWKLFKSKQPSFFVKEI